MLKRFVSFALCFAVLLGFGLSAVPDSHSEVNAASVYSGPYVQVGEVTLPLEEHMPGTFFTKNGQACTNHATADCIANGSDCNCMRYYPTGNPTTCEIDLLAVQCYGFSRLVFYKCFGFLDHPVNSSRYHSIGYILNGWVTESSVKNLLMQAAPGAHIRLARGHSVSILSMDEEYITVYHANSGGDNVPSASCVVSTIRFTWAEFAEYASYGIEFVNMPNEYPGWDSTDPVYYTGTYLTTDYVNLRAEANTDCEIYLTVPVDTELEITEIDGEWGKTVYKGYEGWICLRYALRQTETYITTDYLNLRAEPNTNCEVYLTIPIDTVIEISLKENGWGKTNYGGYSGWVSLTYAKPYEETAELTPVDDTFVIGDDGLLRGVAEMITCETFKSYFEGQEIVLRSLDGTELKDNGFVTTGTVVQLMVNGKVAQETTLCLAGDINCDGKIMAVDYLMTKRSIFGLYDPSDISDSAGDIDGDGKLSASDYLGIQRYCITGDESFFANFK